MQSEISPLKSIISRDGSASFHKRERHVTIQGSSTAESNPYPLLRSINYLDNLISQIEQEGYTTSDPILYPRRHSYGDTRASNNSLDHSPNCELECNKAISRIRPTSAPRQTDHWMSDTRNPRIQNWLR
ncbi:hypothetical protein LOD99_2015 [Oopsacas minuta]|uniref:Uncharacterized protein n=1 Tax=Oopsacas minuta TaxID=111878 RepID=A0AAV7K3Q3_9METZ|nr:hypothetical protein LOD99_2015 [Oopsacas minuta]